MMNRWLLILALLTVVLTQQSMAQGDEVLQLSVTPLSARINHLSWDRPSYTGSMGLYRKMSGQSELVYLKDIEVSQVLSVNDTLPQMMCGDSVEYQMVDNMMHPQNISNLQSVQMNDSQPTSECTLRVATVDETSQKIVLSWEVNPDTDIMGYYLCSGNPCVDYDTVWGRSNCQYICEDYPSTEVHTFRLLAFDSCMNQSPLTEHFNNMVLHLQAEDCSSTINLSWNTYNSMPEGLDRYLVQARYDGASWQNVATVAADAATESQIEVPGNVASAAFRVVAQNSSHTLEAASNIASYTYSTADSARYLYISHASVAADGLSVDLAFYVDGSFPTNGYTLYRALDDGAFTCYATIPYTGSDHVCFVDTNAYAVDKSYRYRLLVVDGCGRNEKFSNTVATIPISLVDDGTRVVLNWKGYQGWGSGLTYTVMRKGNSETYWSELADVATLTYTDDLSSLGDLREGLCYRVRANEPSGSNYHFADTAYSAQVLYKRDGTMYFPNAFTPDWGDNNEFGPEYSFLDETRYEFYIYDRQGHLVFSTTDPSKKWDGTYKGARCPQGVYVYTARCHFLNHIFKQYTGTVMIIR